jgi:hypothetical protein
MGQGQLRAFFALFAKFLCGDVPRGTPPVLPPSLALRLGKRNAPPLLALPAGQ